VSRAIQKRFSNSDAHKYVFQMAMNTYVSVAIRKRLTNVRGPKESPYIPNEIMALDVSYQVRQFAKSHNGL